MPDEQGLSPPLEGHVLALRDVRQGHLDLGHGEHVLGRRQVADEHVDDGGGPVGAGQRHAGRHEVGEAGAGALRVGVAGGRVLVGGAAVEAEVGHLEVRVRGVGGAAGEQERGRGGCKKEVVDGLSEESYAVLVDMGRCLVGGFEQKANGRPDRLKESEDGSFPGKNMKQKGPQGLGNAFLTAL